MNVRSVKKQLVTCLFLIYAAAGWAQDLQVRGGFIADSTRIGEETLFYLATKYPSELNMLFPDTTFNFSPFEYKKKVYFPTKTSEGGSYDSVVYYLTTFEVDSIQTLKLPVYQLNASDCTSYASNRDSILLAQMVRKLPDSLTGNVPVRATVAYHRVTYQINYPLILVIAAVVIIVAAIIWFFFGEHISRYYRVKRMLKLHQNFITTYTTQLANIEKTFSTDTAESALSTWKKYMEQLNGKPYTKLTSRELMLLEKDEVLGRNLRALDGAIYGHNTRVIDSLNHLKSYANSRFEQKVKEVRHD